MDILYIVGTGSKWNNNELRYSLRSIEKNGRNIDRVFLCGYKPAWVSREVIHIVAEDKYPRKHKNILHKVLKAIDFSDISSHFLISSDDHYYIKETDFDALPVYYRREQIPNILDKNHDGEYFRSLIETRALLERYGLPIFQTNPHCNTHFDADVYRRNKMIFDDCMNLYWGGELNCVMGNLLINEGWESKPYKDCKLGVLTNGAHFKERIGESECLSSISRIEGTYIQQFLREEFPQKSRFEI